MLSANFFTILAGSGMHDASSQKEEDSFCCTAYFYSTCRNLQTYLFYLLGLFVTVWEYVKGLFPRLREKKVELYDNQTSLIDSNSPAKISKSSVVVPQ